MDSLIKLVNGQLSKNTGDMPPASGGCRELPSFEALCECEEVKDEGDFVVIGVDIKTGQLADRELKPFGSELSITVNEDEYNALKTVDDFKSLIIRKVSDGMKTRLGGPVDKKITVNSLIDFRYSAGVSRYGPKSKEYAELEKLEGQDWEDYLTLMAGCGVTVEYDLVQDKYIVKTAIGA